MSCFDSMSHSSATDATNLFHPQVYVYYFASFIVLLREVLRPGVLWFLRNLNDPDFSPIQVRKMPFLEFLSGF